MTPDEIAGSHASIYEAWYNQIDKNHTNVIGALDAAKFLKKSGLQDNVLGQIWDIADSRCMGQLDKTGFFVALKMIALAQNAKHVDLSNVRSNVPPPNMGEPPPAGSFSPAISNGSTVWTVKPEDKQRYDQIFNSLGPINERLPGNKVREVLLNSKLPMDTLGRIWDLSDIDKDGFLDRDEFTIAMHLVYKALAKCAVPAALPAELLPAAKRGSSLGTMPDLLPTSDGLIKPLARPVAQQQWVVSASDKARSDVMFRAADLDQDGFVSGAEIRDIFLKSGVPQLCLAHIWNLCDMKQTGKLNREQFALALHLIQQKLQGVEPPAALTPAMVPPTLRPKPGQEPPAPP
ncbi:epidermal growth factor receptor substrate 15-like 1, partial [Pollicipes pollicipes]